MLACSSLWTLCITESTGSYCNQMCVKELGLIFCLLFTWLDLLFVIWYLGVCRSAVIPVRCLPVQVRCLDMGKLHMGWILFGASRLPCLCFSKLILCCRIFFAMLTVIFVCLHVKQIIWGTQHLPLLVFSVVLSTSESPENWLLMQAMWTLLMCIHKSMY